MIYRVSQRFFSKRYFVEQRYDYMPIWFKAFWQEFETKDEACQLMQAFEAPSKIKHQKAKSARVVKIRIQSLLRQVASLECQPRLNAFDESKAFSLESEAHRLCGLLDKFRD